VFPLNWKDPKTGETSSGYREAGYFPEAVVNFLALLGWNSGTEQEIFSMQELVELFSLERVSKSGAKFDYEKGKWFNHKYIQLKPNEEITDLFNIILVKKDIIVDTDKLLRITTLMKERVNFVSELWEQCSFFFVAPTEYEEKAVQKRWKSDSPLQMAKLAEILETIDDFSAANTESIVMQWITDNKYSLGAVMNAFRLALVGASKGPHIFDITEILGKEETLKRIKNIMTAKCFT
jgi:glutamyl-tRNA synthetase